MGGALWGAAEIAGRSGHSLRLGWGDQHFGQESFDFWRCVCLPVFLLCLGRWALKWRVRNEAVAFSELQEETPKQKLPPKTRGQPEADEWVIQSVVMDACHPAYGKDCASHAGEHGSHAWPSIE